MANALRSNTSAETVEILERSGRADKLSPIAPVVTIGVLTIMVAVTLALMLMQATAWLETQQQFSLGATLQAIAGR